jgi:hypothetical protein
VFEHKTERVENQVHTHLIGVMDEVCARAAILSFEAALRPNEPFEFHVHLGKLERFEAAARQAWTEALRRHRKNCTYVKIYGARPLARMAAATVTMMLRLRMDFADED